MRTNKLLVFVTIALLAVNIVLAYFLWNNKRGHGRKGERREERGDWVVKELGLDDKQKAEHKSLKDAHFNRMKPVQDSISAARKNLYHLIMNSNANDSLKESYFKMIGEQHGMMSRYTFDHFQKVRAMLKPEQQAKMDTIMEKLFAGGDRKRR